MKLSDFDYHIPREQIAQHPLPERDVSKLFVVRRDLNKFEHATFIDLTGYLRAGDVLVLNDTRVIPARLFGTKSSGGRVEILLLKELCANTWEALVKGLREGNVIVNKDIIAHVSRSNGAPATVRFEFNNVGAGFKPAPTPDIKKILHNIGVMPLPPYIKRDPVESDMKQYQTVYADKEGAVAAPTAGLHFTERLLDALRVKGVEIQYVTLHVGHGTFKPVKADDVRQHTMDKESYEIPGPTACAINRAKSEGRRIIAVGTTVTRTLESAALPTPSGPGTASIFIYPGYRFRVIDALITNFHQPKSTPVMLTSAFAGLNLLKKAYSTARQRGYRFFSYGDAMLII
ncbi:MAG: tRNA preQ1(34) S-adenosylmethionine ribosyltransferase-isomerase QueA [Nitrospiraceae bacterium]|nr:MAG: tRNA preQ1(34) S-adenosylmethionine ribosyltransferase-isomerase QueA [Nitrospiraceae bacterium]